MSIRGCFEWIRLSLIGATSISAAAATNTPAPAPQLQDIVDPIVIGSPWIWVWRSAAILGIAALIALAWWWWKRRHPTAVETASVPPDVRARARLAAALKLIFQPERFATEVSEIARTYLEERFGLHAPERTTEEFLAELSTSVALDAHHKTLLTGFLTNCDLVKFARAEPDRAELEALHAAAGRLVDETAPQSIPAVPPLQPAEPTLKS